MVVGVKVFTSLAVGTGMSDAVIRTVWHYAFSQIMTIRSNLGDFPAVRGFPRSKHKHNHL